MGNTGDTRALLNIQEAAEVLNVSVSTLRRWDREGKLPALRPGGARLIRYRPADLHAFTQGESHALSAS
jgi:DNA repair protein RadD